MFSKIDTYITKILIKKIILICSAFFILIFLIDMLENSRKLSDSFTAYDLLELSALRSLNLISQILFFVTFLASLFTFLQLAKTSELQVMKTSGISNLQLAKPFLIVVFILSLLPALVFSNINNYIEQKQISSFDNFGQTGLWLKEQGKQNYFLINFKGFDNRTETLKNVSVICLICQNFDSKSLIKADYAKIGNNQITLHNVVSHETNNLPKRITQYSFDVSFTKEFLLSYIKNHNKQKFSFFKLFEQIKTAENNGINTIFYEIELHNYLTTPLLFIAIFMLAMLLGNVKPREIKTRQIILLGITFNFIIYFVIAISQNLIYLKLGNILTFIYLPKLFLVLLLLRQLILRLE